MRMIANSLIKHFVRLLTMLLSFAILTFSLVACNEHLTKDSKSKGVHSLRHGLGCDAF